MSRTRARRPLVPGAVLLALLLPACASVPTSSGVREGAVVAPGGEDRDSFIRLLPQPPAEGEDPREVVEGFLESSASFEDDHRIARLHLDPSVRSEWDPRAGVVVYDRPRPLVPTGDGEVVTLRARRVATIDREGRYQVAPSGATVRDDIKLHRVAGEWRITDPPDGLLLTRNDATRSFRLVNLYFPAPEGNVLVPDQAYLALRRPGLATLLTHRLLDGPSDWLAPAVRSAFPDGTRLARGQVNVDTQGVATVDLTSQAARASPETRAAMSAQLVWTLRQVPEVSGVRVTVDGSALSVPGGRSVQSRDAWRSYDPDGLASNATGYLVQRGRLAVVKDSAVVPPRRPARERSAPLFQPAVSLDSSHVATLTPGADALRIGRIGARQGLATRLRGAELTAPSWDRYGNVWTVDHPSGRTPAVWAVTASRPPRRVQVSGLGEADVLALQVSRDGTRVALVTVNGGTHRLLVGRVIRAESLRIDGLRDVTGRLQEMTDVAWAAADRLAVLARDPGGPMQVMVTDVDGSTSDRRGAVADITALAAGPAAPGARPLLVGTSSGVVYQNPAGNRWQLLGEGSDPLYPG